MTKETLHFLDGVFRKLQTPPEIMCKIPISGEFYLRFFLINRLLHGQDLNITIANHHF